MTTAPASKTSVETSIRPRLGTVIVHCDDPARREAALDAALAATKGCGTRDPDRPQITVARCEGYGGAALTEMIRRTTGAARDAAKASLRASKPVPVRRPTAATVPFLAEVKRLFNAAIYARVRELFETSGEAAARRYVQSFHQIAD